MLCYHTRLLIHVEKQGFLEVAKIKVGETLVVSGDQDGQIGKLYCSKAVGRNG